MADTPDTGTNPRPPDETIAGTGPGIPDDALAPGETELPAPPSDEEVGKAARALDAPVRNERSRTMAFEVSSPSFADGGALPDIHARDHGNVLPALDWRGAPEGTESYAVIVRDPDAPQGTVTHLAVCDIGPEHPGLVEGQDLASFTVCTNVFGDTSYGGPRPPAGHGPHHYHFKVRALDVPTLDVRTGDDPQAMIRAAEGHVVAEAETVGIYEHGEK